MEYDDDFSDDEFDLQQEIARSAFADMCHDWERNEKYDRALQVTIAQLHRAGLEAHVLDIGTGSGLLAMMAVRAGADSVVACEAFRPMADCAERVMMQNGFLPRIRLVKKRSTQLVVGPGLDMERRANVLVTELFDTELIGEGALATYRHALENLLTSDVKMIPHSATVYAQVVECPLAMSWQTPKSVISADGDVLVTVPEDIRKCRGSVAVFDLHLSEITPGNFNALSEPIAVFEFVWNKCKEMQFSRTSEHTVRALTSGFAQAVFMWWSLSMEEEGTITLSCAPYWAHPDFKSLTVKSRPNRSDQRLHRIPWRDHWLQAIYYLPANDAPLAHNQEFKLRALHDEFSLWFDRGEGTPTGLEHCGCGLHIAYSRSRIGQLNDSVRNKKYLNYFEKIITHESVVLVLSDGSLLGMAIAKLGARQVLIHEANPISRRCMDAFMKCNGLSNVMIYESIEKLRPEEIATVTHVFGEPHFMSAVLPWDNLSFGVVIRQIRQHLNADAMIIPRKATIHAVPVEFVDLHKINYPLEMCQGFNLSAMDQLIAQHSSTADANVEAQPLWEYPCYPLAKSTELLSIDIGKHCVSSGTVTTGGHFELNEQMTMRGVALWIDWHLDGSDSQKTTICTGPVQPVEGPSEELIQWNRNWRQGVYLSKEYGKEVKTVPWNVTFDPVQFNVTFHFESTEET